MKNQITWNRDQRDLAAEDSKTLFAVGIDGRPNKTCRTGCYIQTGLMNDKDAAILFLFSSLLADGKPPRKALDEAIKKIGQRKPKARTAP